MNWSAPWLAIEKTAPPITPAQRLYAICRLEADVDQLELARRVAPRDRNWSQPPGNSCSTNTPASTAPAILMTNWIRSVQMTAFIPPR